MDTRLEKIKEILQTELHVDSVPDDAKQEDWAEWDSMSYMSIVARVQEEFGVKATPANIESFSSVRGILAEIQKARGEP